MTHQDAGKFRKCWMFDTHHAVYHLDEGNNIIWIHCDTIRDEVIWIQSGTKVEWYLWNPWVYALENAKNTELKWILQELSTTYSYRIEKWLKASEKQQIAA